MKGNRCNGLLWATLLLLCCITHARSQFSNPEFKTDQKLFLCNTSFGFVTGAIGVLLNDSDADLHDILITGGLQGAIGGTVIFLGKKQIHRYVDTGKPIDFWSSKLLFSAGNSIIRNASFNRALYFSYEIDYLFLRLRYDVECKRFGLGINYSELALNTFSLVNERKVFKTDLKSSLLFGTFISTSRAPDLVRYSAKNNLYRGIIINHLFTEGNDYHRLLAHELVHHFQDHQHSVLSSWINNKIFAGRNNWMSYYPTSSGRKFYFFSEYLPPLSHDLFFYPAASYFSERNGDYYSNVYEAEARHFSVLR